MEITLKNRHCRQADPMLTYSNILYQARIYRKKHSIESTNLGDVLEHMTRHTYWTPSVEMMRHGLNMKHYKLFTAQVTKKIGKTKWFQLKKSDLQ